MKISKKWAWGVLVLILALFVVCISVVLTHSAMERPPDIILVYDGYAETQTYKTFFAVFTEELLQFIKKNQGKIPGQHRVFILEFYRVFEPTDKMIFIYLDLNESLKEPLLVHRERMSKLGDAKSMKAFAGRAIESLMRIIGEKGPKKREI